MKKIVGIVAAASLVAGLAFADEPVANLGITDFTGNAQVQWGVDLDAGQTGFKNSEYMKFVINLFDAGSKATSSDNDVWAELEMKAGNTGNWNHKLYGYDSNTDYTAGAVNQPVGGELSFDITAAKLHFGDFYVGIQNGDTQTGEYKFDGAIRSADNGNAQWLNNVGPAGFSQGIVAGFGNDNLGIDVDFRSNPSNLVDDNDDDETKTNQYTSDYAIALEAKLKDSNEFVEGLFVDVGASMRLSNSWYKSVAVEDVKEAVKHDYTYTTVIDGQSVTLKYPKRFYYSFNAGYKLKIDDKNWLKPAVGMTGNFMTASDELDVFGHKYKVSATSNSNKLVAGVMFGWGEVADANAGLYYFDSDASKKTCPGVSVVAWIPLASKNTATVDNESGSSTSYGNTLAVLTPSFVTKGELVEGLKAAVYSEMAILRSDAEDVKGRDSITYVNAKDKNDTFALALAGAVAYDIKADEITVTPQAGFRFVNTAYADNKINENSPLSTNKFFDGLGIQDTVTEGERAKILNDDGKPYLLKDGYFNLKAGVNVNGLIPNTDIFGVYESANLLNATDYHVDANKNPDGSYKKFYNVKLGTFNVGCKISL